MKPRIFDDRPAVREKTPVLVGLVGPSGSGKTYSALRLAAGFQRVTGGETFFIDTEARRALHYAEKFNFRHVAFGAPFSPLDYLSAIQHCMTAAERTAKTPTIVIDSMSHEHEGPGGVLEMHQEEHTRLGGREGTKMLAWGKPKAARRRLINSILQLEANFVFCFRAKQKLKIERGKEPENLGYQPIGADEFIYEFTLKCLLLPGANGVPTWQSDMIGEKAMIKLPEQFRQTFNANPQLTEDIGAELAAWGVGGSSSRPSAAEELAARYDACSDGATMRLLEQERKAAWSTYSNAERAAVKASKEAADKRIEAASVAPPTPEPQPEASAS
jgi:hypothetical protein